MAASKRSAKIRRTRFQFFQWLQPDIVVAAAASGERAVELHRHHVPDLTLMDVRLPGMNGNEAIRTVHVRPAHFCREFKRTAGLAPHQYLTQKRLEAAQRLLAETDLPIVQVSLQAGFQSQSHFTTTFRQRIGLTPKSYRDR